MELSCPICQSMVVWKACPPRRPEISCQRCAHSWMESPPEFTVPAGVAEGDWEELELEKLSGIDTKFKDWHFIKGRRTWAAFRNWWPAEMLIATTMLDEMMDWVETSDKNPKWRREYVSRLTSNPVRRK